MTTQGIVVSLFGRSAQGTGRTKNEDTFIVSDFAENPKIHRMISHLSLPVAERGVLIAVSDGMGGARAGEVASALTVDALRQGMSTAVANSADAALRVSVEGANQEVFDTARSTAAHAGMGATLTALLFHGIHAYIAEVGDSSAYLVRGGRMVKLTHDQTYVQELVDAGVISPEQAKTSEFKHVIVQAVGLSSDVDVVMNRIAVRRKDVFLVCSDGLSGVLGDQMILDLIAGSDTLQSACGRLVEAAVQHGGSDDITVVLAELDGENAPLMTEAERRSFGMVAVGTAPRRSAFVQVRTTRGDTTMKVSELKDKTVITVPGGELIGTVTDVLLNSVEQRMGALVINSARFAALQVVLAQDISAIDGDAVTIAGVDKLKDQTRSMESNQMVSCADADQRQVATVSGNYLGKLTDVHVDAETGYVRGYEVTGGVFARMFGQTHTIEASGHTRLGNDFLIVADEAVSS